MGIKGNPRAILSCMDRQNLHQRSSIVDAGFVGTPKVPRSWLNDLYKRCNAARVTYQDAEKFKYLAILEGTGYTGRFKDFLTFGSLSVRWYAGPDIYEHFEVGLVDGVHVLNLHKSARAADVKRI